MRFLPYICVTSVLSFSAACGAPEVAPGPLSSLTLLPLDATPGCYESAPESFPNDPDPETLAARAQKEWRASLNLELFDLENKAHILVEPILEAPDATAWDVARGDGRVEAEVLAAGDTWATVHSVLSYPDDDAVDHAVAADIEVLPGETRYTFGDRSLRVAPNILDFEDGVRGCDPVTQTSFQLSLTKLRDEGVVYEALCWPPEGSGDLLSCVQLIDRVRQASFD